MSDKGRGTRTEDVRRVGAAGVAALLAAVMLAGCASAPPPEALPPPLPQTAPEPASPPPETSRVWLRVTGSRVNVREAASTSARTVAKAQRGTRLEKRGEQADWFQVALESGVVGWVSARYVAVETPCPPDSTEPEVVSAPPVGFAADGPHGRVVLEATVAETGEVRTVEVKENSTGSAERAQTAAVELRQVKFQPFFRGCRAVPFIYVFTRTF